MQLTLTRQELDVLRESLRLYLSQAHDEVMHTDDRTYKALLKNDVETLKEIISRLDALDAGRDAA